MAFVDASHARAEADRLRELEVEEAPAVEDNSKLAEEGRRLAFDALCAFVTRHFPRLPRDGVEAVVRNGLLQPDRIADVAFHIGIKDLILSQVL